MTHKCVLTFQWKFLGFVHHCAMLLSFSLVYSWWCYFENVDCC